MHQGLSTAFGNAERYKCHNKKSLYYSSFGKVSAEPSSFSRQYFTSSYRSRLSSEWSPHMRARPIPPLSNQTPPIYLANLGMLPHYTGHIPGAPYRFGKTFGNDTRDAKIWLTLIKPH